MLSVLVPIYNFNVVDFATELHKQCSQADIDFEIRCYDDGSDAHYKDLNRPIEKLDFVTYTILENNVGRSKIRNLLAKDAKYQKLIFVDCDSEIPNDKYIQNYLIEFPPTEVVYGGRTYHQDPPNESDFMLRWKYGIQREHKTAENRRKEPYRNFMTNNFLVDRTTLLDIRFDESLEGYGYEDLEFALSLKKKNVQINHIENPLIHVGLEPSKLFLEKTENGMANLAKMIKAGKVSNSIKVYRVYKKLESFQLLWVPKLIYSVLQQKILLNLSGKNPNLKYFDLYKLVKLIQALKLSKTAL